MKLEHGFTTREEWAEFFNQYYASIRLINQKANELLHTKDGVESWIEKYKECSALQRSIYVSRNQQIQRHIEYFQFCKNSEIAFNSLHRKLANI